MNNVVDKAQGTLYNQFTEEDVGRTKCGPHMLAHWKFHLWAPKKKKKYPVTLVRCPRNKIIFGRFMFYYASLAVALVNNFFFPLLFDSVFCKKLRGWIGDIKLKFFFLRHYYTCQILVASLVDLTAAHLSLVFGHLYNLVQNIKTKQQKLLRELRLALCRKWDIDLVGKSLNCLFLTKSALFIDLFVEY